jgi:hypothetical protein
MPFAFIFFGISFLTSNTAAIVSGISGLDRLLAQRTPILSSKQQICNRSKPFEIAAVPGLGEIFIGAAGDLHQYLGVPEDSPEVE